MAEKTEKPTPKRLREARKKGQVAFSRDAQNVVTYIVGIAVVLGVMKTLLHVFETFFLAIQSYIALDVQTLDDGLPFLKKADVEILMRSVFFLAPVALVGLALGLAQTKMNVSFHPLKPDLKKLNPMRKLKQIFSVQGLFEFAKTVLKLGIVLGIGYAVFQGALGEILHLTLLSPLEIGHSLKSILTTFLFRVALIFTAIGFADFLFQRWKWQKDLMMSKHEVKQEFKEEEGDPLIKSQRKSLHRALIFADVRRAVKQADVVTVNPTHLAVALEYDQKSGLAPRVTAKGQEKLAQKIVMFARKFGVPVIRNVELTRALFELELDEHIPPELYEAVAEVLLMAWKIREGEV